MLKLLISALIYIPAVLSGLGMFAPAWLAISAALAFAKSIITVGNFATAGDFHKQTDEAFMRSHKLILIMTVLQLVMVAFLYWIGSMFA